MKKTKTNSQKKNYQIPDGEKSIRDSITSDTNHSQKKNNSKKLCFRDETSSDFLREIEKKIERLNKEINLEDRRNIQNILSDLTLYEGIRQGYLKAQEDILKMIDELKFETIHYGDEGTNCFIEVVITDKLKQKIKGETNDKKM
jgi:hypothetical protein